MGLVNLLVGQSADELVTCYDGIADTGFYELPELCAGTVVQLYKVDKLGKCGTIFAVSELRLFQTPNLIKTFQDQVKITGPEPDDTNFKLENLITNLDSRTAGKKYAVSVTNEAGSFARANHESCFSVSKS